MDDLTHSLLPVERELAARVRWFVRLRWLAGAGVLLTALVLRVVLQWPLSPAVEVIGLGVLVYNVPFWWLVSRQSDDLRPGIWTHLANFQINIDFIALTALLHFTGGVFSPLLPFAVFHIMIGSLLLRRRDVFLQAGFAIALVALLGWAEWSGALAAETLGNRLPAVDGTNPAGVILVVLGFAALLIISAVLASTVGYDLRRLERKDAEAHAELEQAHRRLHEMDRAKTRFTLTVTHELRAPLAAVQTMLDVLRQGLAGDVPAAVRGMIGRAGERVEVLLELVTQLLDLAREKADLEPQRRQRVSIRALLDKMDEAYRTQAEAQKIQFTIDAPADPLTVPGSADELGKLCSNLVGNAVKYTPTGGRVSVRARRDGRSVVLEIADTGIGIPQDEQARLFTEFFRASNARERVAHGTGLGLTIVKRIAEMHGGSLRFESKEGVGTTFWITLPLADAAQPAGGAETAHEHAAATSSSA